MTRADPAPWTPDPRLRMVLAGIELQNPLILASGVLGVGATSLDLVARQGVGAVTTKSCSLEARAGHPNPIVAVVEAPRGLCSGPIGLLNAVGLSNPGAIAMAQEIRAFQARSRVPVFGSVFGRDPGEFAEVAAILAQAGPALLELNVSCPNVADEFGIPFAASPEATAAVLARVRDAVPGMIPIAVKLSTNCPSLTRMAKVCEDQGASAITAINTVGPGLTIDVPTARPILSNLTGGLSGPAILPLAVKAVWEIHRAVRLPILGTGGVTDGQGALQMILAGASAVGVGTAVWLRGIEVFREISLEISEYLDETGCGSLKDLVGVAHGR